MKLLANFAESPVTIATASPHFSWQWPAQGRAQRQSAYQVLVASDASLLQPGRADLWDSGKVNSDRSSHVLYAGNPLESNRDYCWTVLLWDGAGAPVSVDATAFFDTPLFHEEDWKASWIGMGAPDEPFSDPDAYARRGQKPLEPEFENIDPDLRAPLLRKAFHLTGPVKRARLFVCGMGLCTPRLNGQKVGGDVLTTPRTDFRKRAVYNTYDIAAQLVEGDNVLGLVLGNGFYNGQKKYWGWQYQWFGSPRALVQLQVVYEDGRETCIVSDQSWQGDWSPIVFNCIYDGEEYDARLEQPGWDRADFDTSGWAPVNCVTAPGGRLVPMECDAETVTEALQPVSMVEPEPGVYVYDMGRNITGWVRMRVAASTAGDAIQLRFGEARHEDGRIDTSSNNAARQADHYISKGGEEAVYEPSFTFHGFQFVELTGYPGVPDLTTVEGRFVRTAVAPSGTFSCSNELINRIHTCTLQSQLCNVQMGVPTDDTQRPERLGWGADAWAVAQEAMYNLWMPRLFTKWIKDFCDMQDKTGVVGMITPRAGLDEDLVWSSAFLLIPWWQYLHYGDTTILAESYPCLQKYIQYLEKVGINKIGSMTTAEIHARIGWHDGYEHRFSAPEEHGYLQLSQWGDHLATAEGYRHWSGHPLSISTAFYYLDVTTMAKIAEVLGKTEDARGYHELADKIKVAFNQRFYDPVAGYYDGGVQSTQAWPLVFGLVPEEEKEKVTRFLTDLVGDRQRRLTTGYASTKFAVQALSQAGRNDIVWQRATSTDYPSWGYMLRKNRTTSCERWDGERGSFNHAPLGAAIDEWFYSDLAGIRSDPSRPGFEHVLLKPYIPDDLAWVTASVQSIRGEIRSAWSQEDGRVRYEATVPPNSTATVCLPCGREGGVQEGDRPVAEAEGVTDVVFTETTTTLTVGSGHYCFDFSKSE